MWSQILILILSPLCILLYLKRLDVQFRDLKYLGTGTLLLVFVLESLQFYSTEILPLIHDILALLVQALVLIILLLTIRLLRPEISRYPYGFAYIPIIVVFLYPLIEESQAITTIIYMMIQAGSVFVLAMLIIGHFDVIKRGWVAIITIISFLSAYLIYWILPSAFEIEAWYWKPFMAIGMLTASLTFPYLVRDHKNLDHTLE